MAELVWPGRPGTAAWLLRQVWNPTNGEIWVLSKTPRNGRYRLSGRWDVARQRFRPIRFGPTQRQEPYPHMMEVSWGGGKPRGFVGMERTLAQKAEGVPRRRLLQVLLDDPTPLMYHGEVVYRNGVVVGDVRAASYGHTLGGAVGLTMVEAAEPITAAWIRDGAWEVDVAGVRYPARASLRPLRNL